MSGSQRRFFWGRTLAQALARAARHHGLAPERLAYRVRDKRHGYLRHPRAVLIEIDPAAPLAPVAAAASRPDVPSAAPAAVRRVERPAPRPARGGEAREEESWDLPDAESELAAAEAVRRLLAFAGLDLAAEVTPVGERLQLTLSGADEAALRNAGAGLLDALEALLPRAIVSLCGRRVRCRIDGAGLRSQRETALRALAREAAAQAREAGELLLEPLPPAERRIVHLELEAESDLATESLGSGLLKRIRVYRRAPIDRD